MEELVLCYQGIQRANSGCQTGTTVLLHPLARELIDHLSFLPFETESLTGLELVEPVGCMPACCPGNHRVCLSLPSQGQNFKCAPPHLSY